MRKVKPVNDYCVTNLCIGCLDSELLMIYISGNNTYHETEENFWEMKRSLKKGRFMRPATP